MKRWSILFLSLLAVLYLDNSSAFAQRARGGGGGRSFGVPGSSGGTERGFGTSRTPSGDQGSYGRTRLPGEETGHGQRDTSNPRQKQPGMESIGSSSGTVAGAKRTTSDLLTQNAKLSSRVETLLPAGTNAQAAADGFDHLGDFVAAAHVSHNLNIPFEQMKEKMMAGKSLGQAIHELRPDVNAREEAIRANEQALRDMEESFGRSRSEAAGQGSPAVKSGR